MPLTLLPKAAALAGYWRAPGWLLKTPRCYRHHQPPSVMRDTTRNAWHDYCWSIRGAALGPRPRAVPALHKLTQAPAGLPVLDGAPGRPSSAGLSARTMRSCSPLAAWRGTSVIPPEDAWRAAKKTAKLSFVPFRRKIAWDSLCTPAEVFQYMPPAFAALHSRLRCWNVRCSGILLNKNLLVY